jgi:hypothetical protein
MAREPREAFVAWTSAALAVVVAVTSAAGLFWPPTYARETPSWTAQGIGGDVANLVLIIPVLLVSALEARRGSMAARLVWLGTLVYLAYMYVLYALDVHFNRLFLVYCAGLGLSVLALARGLAPAPASSVAERYGSRAPVKTMATVLVLLGAAAGSLWLREIVPALLSGATPRSVAEVNLPTNPVHVLDLSLLIPAVIVAAVLLVRRRPFGFVVAPVLLVFLLLMTAAVATMGFAMGASGTQVVVFLVPSVIPAAVLIRYFRPSGAAGA